MHQTWVAGRNSRCLHDIDTLSDYTPGPWWAKTISMQENLVQWSQCSGDTWHAANESPIASHESILFLLEKSPRAILLQTITTDRSVADNSQLAGVDPWRALFHLIASIMSLHTLDAAPSLLPHNLQSPVAAWSCMKAIQVGQDRYFIRIKLVCYSIHSKWSEHQQTNRSYHRSVRK